MAESPYAALAKVKDAQLRAVFKLLLDQIGALQGQAESIGGVTRPLEGALDAAGNRLSVVADPEAEDDAVNLRTLRQMLKQAQATLPTRPAPTPVLPPGYIPPVPPPPPTGPVPPAPPPGDPTDPGGPPVPAGPPGPSTGPFAPPQTGSGNLRINGKLFYTPGGSVYYWRSCTDFLLLKKHLDGEDITPILADRTAAGAHMVRVLGMCVNIADFNPANYPNYLIDLPGFMDLLAANGLDCEFVVFADAQALAPFDTALEQQEWLGQVRDALLGKPNVVLELVNEGFKNGVNYLNHTRPTGILSCADSDQKPDDYPATPPWDYATLHTPRDAEWPRKAKNAMEVADILGRPAICDEPMGADEVNIPGSRSNVPNDFFDYAAVAMLLAGGATFHSQDGVTSSLFRPTTLACANAFYAAINVIPENVLLGTYTRGPLSDCPIQHSDALALRTFARYTDHNACCVVVRPEPGWVAIAQAGWTIVGSGGPGGRVVFLTK